MEKIASFTVDHTKLKKGIYVSRKDKAKEALITTFDLRMKEPNKGDYLSTTAAHTIEHLGATMLRNNEEIKDKVIYFGPMGCRTGFYLLMAGDYDSNGIAPFVKEMFESIVAFEGEVPGQSEKECGNYKDLSLDDAKKEAAEYLKTLENLKEENLVYAK